ncbi:hypothetical protein Salat_0187700, partial [Sesamum alatum]
MGRVEHAHAVFNKQALFSSCPDEERTVLQPTIVFSRASDDEQAVFSNTVVYSKILEKVPLAPMPITQVELKPLPSTLRNEFLEPNLTYPVIVNVKLNESETSQLLEVLRLYKSIIGYTIDDIKGINPSVCMHRIHLEDDFTPVEPQRRLNPNMKE